jgi:hypothetical protein
MHIDDICHQLCDVFDVTPMQCREQVSQFLNELREHDLIA